MRAESFKESLSRRCKIKLNQLTGETPEECITQAREIMSERELQGERETIEIRAVRKWVDTMEEYAKNGYRII